MNELNEYVEEFKESASEIEKIGFEFLVDIIGYDEEDAAAKADEVIVWEGALVDYAEELMNDCYEIPDHLVSYIDYDKFARDLDCGGDVYHMGDAIWIINPHDF